MAYEDEDRMIARFNIRAVNVTKLTQPVDCEIIIAEADHSIEGIKQQIKEGFGDADWLKDATRAITDIDHKKKLAKLKLDALLARANVPPDPQGNFKARFLKAAEEILPPAQYQRIREAAAFEQTVSA